MANWGLELKIADWGETFFNVTTFKSTTKHLFGTFSWPYGAKSIQKVRFVLQVAQLYMGVWFWYLLVKKIYLSSVCVYSSLHRSNHFLQGTRKTRSCLPGRVVAKNKSFLHYYIIIIIYFLICFLHSKLNGISTKPGLLNL